MNKFFLPLFLTVAILVTSCDPKDKPNNIDPKKDTKIGYLFYASFIDEFNSSLYQTFDKFKKAGVTDLIIDLRYNHGGSLAAASYLASFIAPRAVVESKSTFVQLDFNTLMNNYYDSRNWSRKSSLGSGAINPLGANLDLKTVYIIATDDSYSASELLTFCLKPYMNVVHVGSNTGGKFTASFTVTPYNSFGGQTNTIYDSTQLTPTAKDSLKNFAMQPIVAIYKDSKGNDFSQAGTLVPTYAVPSRENDLSAYKPLGDRTDYLLSATISKILEAKGQTSAFVEPTMPRNVNGMKPAKLFSQVDNIRKEAALWKPIQASSGVTIAGINTVSQFAFDGLLIFYKWNDHMKNMPPTNTDTDPFVYFNKVLYPLDTEHGWSWMTDNVQALLADFSGEPVDFGWALNFYWTDASKTSLVAFVKYVYPNTPASQAGVQRGELISKINGVSLTANSSDIGYYMKLLGQNTLNITIGNNSGSRSLSLTPVTISTNPVLKDTVYTIPK